MAISSWSRRIFSCSPGGACCRSCRPAVVAPALDLLLAALHLVGPFRRQVFQVLVIPGQVHVAGLPVSTSFFRGPGWWGGGPPAGAAAWAAGRACSPWGLAAVVVPPWGTVAALPRRRCGCPRWGVWGWFWGRVSYCPPVRGCPYPRFWQGQGVQGGLEIGHLVVLGQVFKHDGQFPSSNTCMWFLGVVAYLVRIWVISLVCFPKSLATSCNTIFFKTQIKPPPSRPGRERPARPLVCSFLSAPVSRYGWER